MLLPLFARQLLPLELLLNAAKISQSLVDSRILAFRPIERLQLEPQRSPSRDSSPTRPAPAAKSISPRRPCPVRISSPACVRRWWSMPNNVSNMSRFTPPRNRAKLSSATTDKIIGTAESAVLAATPDDLELLATTVPQFPRHAKLVVGMDEVVRRQMRKAKKQVRQCASVEVLPASLAP